MPTGQEPAKWSYAKRLDDILQRQGWTQASLARALNVDRSTVARWLSGDRAPDPDTLKRIAETAGISIDEVLELDLSGAWPSHKVARAQQHLAAVLAVAREAERDAGAERRKR